MNAERFVLTRSRRESTADAGVIPNPGGSPRPSPRASPSPRGSPRPSPRVSHIVQDSPLARSRRGSATQEDTAFLYVQAQLPRVFQLIKDGQESLLFKIVEDTFHLLGSLQHQCLPLDNRNIGTQHYITLQKQLNAEMTLERYEKWKEKEQAYLKDALDKDGLGKLAEEYEDLISDIRESVFSIIYEEQQDLKKEQPFSPFLSIFDASGQRNYVYAEQFNKVSDGKMHSGQAKKAQARSKERIESLEACFTTRMQVNEVAYDKSLSGLVRKVATADRQAIFMRAYEEGIPLGDADSFLLDIVLSDPNSSDPAYWKAIKTSIIADKRWQKYSEREAAIFEEKFENARENFTEEEEALYDTVRAVIFRLIYEEQATLALPFVSIFNAKGGMNENFWIEHQDARAKMRKEKPFDDNRPLKDYSDFDVVCINTAPAKTAGGSLEDSTGVRETGSVVKEYCSKILQQLKQSADEIKAKFSQPDVEGEEFAPMFQKCGLHEQLLVIQDAFCEALARTHYVRGFSAVVLKKLNIKFVPTSPRILPIANEQEHPLFKKCDDLASEMQNIKAFACSPVCSVQDPEEVIMQLQFYGTSMDAMGNELQRLAMIIQGFASSLRLRPASPRTKVKMPSLDAIEGEPSIKFVKAASMGHIQQLPLRKSAAALKAKPAPLTSLRLASLQAQASPRRDSPRVTRMNPEKFEEIARLLFKVQQIFKDAAMIVQEDCLNLETVKNMAELDTKMQQLKVERGSNK